MAWSALLETMPVHGVTTTRTTQHPYRPTDRPKAGRRRAHTYRRWGTLPLSLRSLPKGHNPNTTPAPEHHEQIQRRSRQTRKAQDMDDHPGPQTDPLKDRIASLLYLSDSDRAQSLGALYPSWDKAPPATRGVFMGRAAAVIDGLSLDYDAIPVNTMDGKHLETTYRVDGGWTEAGGDW